MTLIFQAHFGLFSSPTNIPTHSSFSYSTTHLYKISSKFHSTTLKTTEPFKVPLSTLKVHPLINSGCYYATKAMNLKILSWLLKLILIEIEPICNSISSYLYNVPCSCYALSYLRKCVPSTTNFVVWYIQQIKYKGFISLFTSIACG